MALCKYKQKYQQTRQNII